ncbi:MAG: Rrf2 family transcriptional regulator [Deltaproteobacteria bacterium]|nr:Rrf2 family transcriptional regulator [Deltaproteobacteria bacterium]MBW2015874.1 Rrf2 family transcriptional regulator [Deltaproteobacteria bacterium]MBW2129627.1 Rrf2 family transcriptional regulator [Deltaproteobacteria bacterium]MBW2303949.1 Rrf2 family transcriptional regulator [Deltaproteobacteria bacterium]
MKLSTRTRYGTRLMLDLARHYGKGFLQLREIAERQEISLKYLEQIVIPLKKAHYIEASRGAKGGYRLARPPEKIMVGEIVALLERGGMLSECLDDPSICKRSDFCPTRHLWKEAEEAIFEKLNRVSLKSLMKETGDEIEAESRTRKEDSGYEGCFHRC